MNTIQDIFGEYWKKKEDIELSVDVVRAKLTPFADKILLYGAGSSGIAFLYNLRKIGITPLFFVDSDERKAGILCEDIEVILPQEIPVRVGEDALVIVCINTDGKRYCKSFDEALRVGGHHAVYGKLRDVGCKNIIDYTYFRHCFALFTDEKYNAPSCSDIYLMEKHEEEIAKVYEYLSDEVSREVYEKIVKFRLLDDTLSVPTMSQEKQYFEDDIYQNREGAVFVDCGAYNGISFQTFLRKNAKGFLKYYGVEPEEYNFRLLKEYIMTLPENIREKVHLINKAVWNHGEGAKIYALHGPGSFIANDIGTEIVETITIDDLLEGEKVTYLKMNIEGSEKEALRGAEQAIRKWKPDLAIAGYHRTDDMWKIPMMIHEYRPDYQLRLRSYMNHISFVYYAN